MSTYPGGKNGSGVYQFIINQMPPHQTYIEPFLGGGAIMRLKRPAPCSIGIDSDTAVIGAFAALGLNVELHTADALAWLSSHQAMLSVTDLVYCDPPYLRSVRSDKGRIYRHEFWLEDEHRELLEILKGLPCMVMISGYWSPLYASLLSTWRSVTFRTRTRGGRMATEYLWMNFPLPLELHDYRYLGDGFRQRERITRKRRRWLSRLQSMPDMERYAVMAALEEFRVGRPSPHLASGAPTAESSDVAGGTVSSGGESSGAVARTS